MHMLLVVGAWLAVALFVTAGVASVVTGWVPWPARRRVVRPRLWGYGTLLTSLGLTLLLLLGPLEDAGAGIVAFGGYCVLFLAGFVVQALAQRPGRDTTKTAS